MTNLLAYVVGFIAGIFVSIWIFLSEIGCKLNIKTLKILWNLISD
jgi:hypothetical protein